MNGAHRLPSPSGARLSGDDFQHVLTWLEVLRLLEPGGVTSVGFEVGHADAGVVDDLVARRDNGHPDRYAQIKFAVDDTTPLTHEWFTTPPRSGAATPLQRFFAAYRDLSKPERPVELELITNRRIATGDPLLEHRAGLTGKLVPRLFATTAAASVAARRAWAAHLETDEAVLAGFLDRLVISPSHGTIDELLERGRGAMALAGLRGDPEAILIALAALRRLIEEGRRELDRDALQALVAEIGLQSAPAYSTLVIAEIAPSPLAALAPAHVDWVDLFPGETPDERRQTADPDAWEAVLRPDLRRATTELRQLGLQRIRVEGAFRLPSAFITGFELSERSGVDLVLPFGAEEWGTDADPDPAPLTVHRREIGQGPDLAIAVAVSADLGDDVEAFIGTDRVPSTELLILTPEDGHGRHSVPGPGRARALAEQIVDLVRRHSAAGTPAVHLFLAVPRPLAVMLGRVWNRVPPTRVYADLNPGYAPTYLAHT